jgi:hypothetical protein
MPKPAKTADIGSASAVDLEAVEARRQNPDRPGDLGEYEGKYTYLPTGETFGLKVLPQNEVRANRTHHAKNATKFWDGTPEEFRRFFDKQ